MPVQHAHSIHVAQAETCVRVPAGFNLPVQPDQRSLAELVGHILRPEELARKGMSFTLGQRARGGQSVYYQARWVSTRGDTGPWGELVSATVVK